MNNLKDWSVFYGFVKPYLKKIALTLLIGIIKFGIPLTLPMILKYLVDHLLLNYQLSTGEKMTQLSMVLGISFFVFVIVRGPVEYYRQYFAQWITSRILYDIRNRLYEHIQKLSIRYYQNRKVGELISRFINDVEQTKNLVEVGMMNVWLDLFTLSIALILMTTLDPVLTLVAISIFPLYGIAVKILYRRLKKLTKDRSQALAEIQGYLHERIQGLPVIRSFTLEKYEQKQFGKRNQHFLDKAMAQTKWNAVTFAVINVLTDIAPLLVIGYGGYMVIQGNLTIGSFVAFFGYLDRLYNPLRRLINSSTVLTQASASLERVVEFMKEPYDIRDKPEARQLPEGNGEILFDHVWFRYNKEDDWVLKDIHLHIKPGQTVALVGMSGGGKSSLIGLIPRFFDIEKGRIEVNGMDIRDVTQISLREEIGMVQQENFLFSGTVRENILLGNPNATEEEMIAAAVSANAHGFITQLPDGYDTEIGERGIKLSGGQKQRVAIARVFLKNPQVLILDEATSALDLESEHLIQQSLQELAHNRTTLIVAHRLSTITHADQIVVMENGEIVEQGTHMELLEQEGSYARLFNVQTLV
ncbi:ABC transporter ATP-binding protein [Paenibacillus larvae]|uniref:ABC transporter-like protein n=2 Tax=Paenibacillus larvae TaxID=1464 RepID=V9W425_9BACL|nr:ABC transporter ATP-binding protein [Paenibacillus larvae]AHD05761.1 ABC transporter-like protein [Paenibacillus larvae subsp. larvae DSM 25430]MCY7478134.1 ABC transporter ATP-binding protein/permease [Paenibacillus larvae]MCY7490385.1 ABC transporter ATP-binding protein/permease [Paenibacillus larvae]MCY9563299.1 ABC transporter ATP-binding protein/permease [Paenibacillus larvae]MCY9568134.1 ABC transporter ATP-binding protein/permease [Paenibacillus larvae]